MPFITLIDVTDALAAHADRPALVVFTALARDEWSYGRLAGTVRELAQGLVSAGLEPGGRAALLGLVRQ